MVERPPLDEDRRLAYLEAMGVSVWEPRASLPVSAEPLVVEPASVAAATDMPTATAPVAREVPPAVVDERPVTAERSVSPEIVSPPESMSFPLPDWEEEADYSPALLDEWEAMGHPPTTEAEAVNPIERMDWNTLGATVRGCRACRLWETRTKTVFGTGDRRADLMIIGEAPGAEEDSQGEPFVGRAGQLLTRMLAAIGFSREQVYIANVLKCRPPGNRDPKPDEALACQAYLHRQVALIEPRVILSVGRISAQHLLKTETPVGQLRGRWFDYGPARIPLRVTYHPAYLLRSPEQKAKAWEDLTEVKRRL
ncbi:uracil-DNA glycosylase [Allochromatium palmeri]|uniref:Type-4 uracil-DNA glycosylase n=1 Tax=Allochromatium palmeri TaxID=231048 RepID=A0A6N8E698_9GAMM|nr:uracil-DNA glycosylase [Allochromatium palmeri]MTW19733.1 uracil-DNA glycosylase [Allochromatium palmeri]